MSRANIRQIQQDAQKVVRLSTTTLETLHALELDTITYNVKDKEGEIVATYEGRDRRQDAYDDCDLRNTAIQPGQPFRVEASSNLRVDEQTGLLTFETGSTYGIGPFNPDEIRAMAVKISESADCETIKELMEQAIQSIIDSISAATGASSDVSVLKEILKLPSNPLKILSWAKKVVSLYFGPHVLAAVDLAIQLASLAQAITQLLNAAEQAKKNLELCYAQIDLIAIDALTGIAKKQLAATNGEIDKALKAIEEAQDQIALITGEAPSFQINNGVNGLIDSVAQGARDKFKKSVNSYAEAPLEDVSISLTMTGDVTGTASTDADGNFTISTTAPAPPASTSVTVLDENGDPLTISVFA